MAEKKIKSGFKAMNVAELKKYLQKRGVSVGGNLKTSLVEIASAVERMVLPVDPNFEKDQTTDADKLIIHDMLISNPFSLKTVNNFNSSPPFGLYDIFNYLIYHSTDYDKQGLAAYRHDASVKVVEMYEGSSPPKSCFKFCYVEPLSFINSLLKTLEQKLNKRNRI